MELDNIATARNTHLVDAHITPPVIGKAYLCLTHGGKLVEHVWKSDSLLYFDAAADYPQIPKSVRRRQLERFLKEAT